MTDGRGRSQVRIAFAAALVLLAMYLVGVWFSAVPKGNLHTGDPDNLVAGARVGIACIERGELTSCGLGEGTRQTQVGPFPLLQYLPATVLVEFGLSDEQVLKDLARLNVLAFAGAIVLCLVAFNRRDRRACAAVAVTAVLASSATYQSSVAFGEMLAATVTLAAVVAVIKGRPVPIIVACALAVLSKETFAPFVFVLGILASRRPGDRWLPAKERLIPLAVGVGLGTIATVGFNLFRFGEISNTFYLDPSFRTPGVRRPAEFFAGLWLSPASGIAWFWPVATIVVLAMTVIAVSRFTRHPRDLSSWLPSATVVLIALTVTAGLALWWSPFGWIAYGPRLAVPLMPAMVVTALHQEADTFERTVRSAMRTWLGAIAVITVAVLIGWPQFGAAWSYQPAITQLIAPSEACTRFTSYSVANEPWAYYTCVRDRMWRTTQLPINKAAGGGGTPAFWARLLLGASVALLLFDARRGPVRRRAPDVERGGHADDLRLEPPSAVPIDPR